MDGHQKIRICHVASGDLWAGAEVQVFNLVSALHEVPTIEVIVLLLNSGRLENELVARGVEVKVIEESKNRFPAVLRHANHWLEGRGVDILHSHRFKENILSAMLKKRNRAKYLVQTVHGLSEPERGVRKVKALIFGLVARRFTRRYANRVVAVSNDIGRVLSTDLGARRVVIVRNSVAMPMGNLTHDRERIRREFSIAPEHILIGTAGRLKPVKAYDHFLRAAGIVADRLPDARFLIAGDGPLRQELQELAKSLGLGDKVMFTGFRNDIEAILASLDLFVMSSRHEGIPVVLLEAMALSRPAVVTAVGGMVEVIESEKSGLLVEAGNPHELARACLRILENPELMRRIGEEGARRVRAEFTRDQQCRRVVALYEQLIANPETDRVASTE